MDFNAIRSHFEKLLIGRPRGISVNEFNDIVNTVIQISHDNERQSFARFDYWIRQPDLEKRIVCANVELVKFGVLSAREKRQTQKKNSEGYIPPSLEHAYPKDLKLFLESNSIPFDEIERLPESVISRASQIDEWVQKSISSKSRIDLLDEEVITTDQNQGNNRVSRMKYISVRDLTTCIARSRNATALRTYAMNLMAIFRIYQEELIKSKDNAIDEKDDAIHQLRKETNQLRKEMKQRDEEQQRKIDELLGHATDIKHQNTELKDEIKIVQEQNVELNSKIEQLTEEIKQLRSDIGGYTNLLVKTCITPSVVTNLIELFSDGQIEFNNRSPHNGIQSCKIMYFATFMNADNTELMFWLACRNFSEVPKRLNEQFNKMKDSKCLGAIAIALCDKDVNEEMKRFNNAFTQFAIELDKETDTSTKEKSFVIKINKAPKVPTSSGCDKSDDIKFIIDEFAKRMRNQFLMRHQKGALMAIRNGTDIQKLQAKEAFRYSIRFNTAIVNHTQNYVDSFLEMKKGVVNRVLSASTITEKVKTDLTSSTGKSLLVKKHIYHMYLIKREASRYQEEQYIREFAEIQNQKDVCDDSDLVDYDIDNFSDFSDSDPES